MIISAPILFASAHASNTPDITIGPLVYIGVIIWIIGFLFEAIGDAQLSTFMKKNSNFKGKEADKPVLNLGLWKYTRHPNYFGNACIWWGIWLVACNSNFGWTTILSPLLMTLLLTRISGRDLLERQMKQRSAYASYIEKTNSFIPWFPKK
jgi:steroid 5-alpha reductase family enzyme